MTEQRVAELEKQVARIESHLEAEFGLGAREGNLYVHLGLIRKESEEWRKMFSAKLEGLFKEIKDLPCEKRVAMHDSYNRIIKLFWAVFIFVIGMEGAFIVAFLAHIIKK